MTDDDDDYIPSKILHKMQEPAPQMRDPIPSKILHKMQECAAEMQKILRDPNGRTEANVTFLCWSMIELAWYREVRAATRHKEGTDTLGIMDEIVDAYHELDANRGKCIPMPECLDLDLPIFGRIMGLTSRLDAALNEYFENYEANKEEDAS